MKYKLAAIGFIFLGLSITGFSQNKYLSIHDFKTPIGAWFETGKAELNPIDEKKLKATEGSGVLISENGKTLNLVTNALHGDAQVDLEFMISKGSNSGVYLQGRYEIQILDSWGKQNPGSGDCGGVYARYDGKKTFEGTPPLTNAAKKPGEWQQLSIQFKAPRFNAKGEKIKNAMFKKVKLNGIVVQKNVVLTGPTASSLDTIETARGPLMCQGDHGPVAYRSIALKHQ